MNNNPIAKDVSVNGIVQGVGFRPFVYQLAAAHNLKGEVSNTSSGVAIHIEGAEKAVDSFIDSLKNSPPALARITELTLSPADLKNYKTFLISKSNNTGDTSTLISPDVSVCDDCLKELFDPEDRRYRYPFINCTNCGPRYTIIDDIPYDRPNTSMKNFIMCEKCRQEYDDPFNRRFHAQPNGCENCGPGVELYDNQKQKIDRSNPVKECIGLLKQGFIVAVKGLGGFHLAVDADNDDAVRTLRKRKMREEKPFAVMSSSMEQVRQFALIKDGQEAFLQSMERPIVLLDKKRDAQLSGHVAPGNRYYGVMLPSTPLHYLLLENSFRGLVMTSGNMSEEPIAIDNEDAFSRLKNIADYFLIHNRDILIRCDDSIISLASGAPNIIRRSRGYVPVPVFLKNKIPSVLGCGAELKSSICITKNDKAFLSQHIGDLENRLSYDFFRHTIEHMKRILNIEPELIACDLHPDYLSTGYALEQQDIPVIKVQHHHAHIAGCMAENKIDGQVIGLSFDGTGYGTDGTIWGGEILITGFKSFRRTATILPTAMPGSAAAIKEPWRMGISYLFKKYGNDLLNLDIPLLKSIPEKNVKIITEMISKNINSPLTTSLGRLFDGVSAICGIRTHVHNEGQAAMDLEMAAAPDAEGFYEYDRFIDNDIYLVNPDRIIGGIVEDLQKKISTGIISAKFHETLIRLYTELCNKISADAGLDRVVLSGGVFQNSVFTRGLAASLEKNGLKVFTHRLVPANDGGISLGQAMVAACSA